MREVAGIGVARGLDKSFPQVGSSSALFFTKIEMGGRRR
jgi:hypothetical protein